MVEPHTQRKVYMLMSVLDLFLLPVVAQHVVTNFLNVNLLYTFRTHFHKCVEFLRILVHEIDILAQLI